MTVHQTRPVVVEDLLKQLPELTDIMPITKKLEKLLLKYKKANQVRLNAYKRRSLQLRGRWDLEEQKRIYPQNVTIDLIKELNANIEKARLYKLEVSKELRAYCKKKKYHLKWGPSNQILEVYSHLIPKS
jgi:hypothetical protein